MDFVIPPRKYERLEGHCRDADRVHLARDVSGIPAQGFCIRVNPKGVSIKASDEAGAYYGALVLAELVGQYPEGQVPCCRIEDWPDFQHRGYMLDISRDRVTTMAHLFHLVDYLTSLRYNQLQLYTEHSFAYSQHKTVWAKASPMTAEEIRELDQYCRDRQIELVPNQNSFGHMERWLEHDEYKHLAECPEGFRHPISGEWRPQGSVIRPDAQSLDFLDGLYSELLPNFRSRKFNIGGDEPWELGEGASRERVEREGKHKVYADFLSQVCQLATEHGAEPICWADVLLEDPEQIKVLPESIQPIIWGYEVDHPFEKQCAQLAALGLDFYVAPGDSTWTSYTGRLSTMLANVRDAASIGHQYKATGLLMTHWGDGGHPQSWPISLPGMVWAGLLSWNVDAEEASLRGGLQLLLGDEEGAYVETLLQCGKLDESLNVPMVNRSYLAYVNRLDDAGLSACEPRPERPEICQFMRDCEDLLDALSALKFRAPDDAIILREELELALRLNLYAASRCLGETKRAPAELRELYQSCWRHRSRPGGLHDSLSKIDGIED